MMTFEIKDKDATNFWWYAWKRAIAELYPLRDTIRRLKIEVKELRGKLWCTAAELVTLKETYKRCADALREADETLIETLEEVCELRDNAPDVIYKERQIALNENAILRRELSSAELTVSLYRSTKKDLAIALNNVDAFRSHLEKANKKIDELVYRVTGLRKENAQAYAEIGKRDRKPKEPMDGGSPAIRDWLKEVSSLLSKQVGFGVRLHAGPYYATAEEYVMQARAASDKMDKIASRASARVAKDIGAKLDHWQGFKFTEGEGYRKTNALGAYNYVSLKPGTINWLPPRYIEAPGAYEWGKDVPKDTQFAIGGKTEPTAGGAMAYYGTETTTVKIMDDTLYRALTSLLEDQGQNEGSRADGRQSRAAGEGSGQDPEISAAVTILPGGRIRLKLKVGRTVHEIRTYLTAGSPKS